MRWIRDFREWRRANRELTEEIEQHLREKIEAFVDSGMAPEDARARALREFGNPTRLVEQSKEVWGFTWLQEIGQDLRYGLRMLRRTPGLTAIAVLSLAIGVGANSAIFSVIDSVVLRVLPVRDPESLAIVQALTRQGNRTSLSHSDYEWLNEHNQVFAGLAASSARQLTRSLDGRTERIQALLVSGNYFTVLGVEPFLGRVIGPDDDGAPAHNLVAVISYSYWSRAFGGDPDALGQRLRFGDTTLEVIGIAPNGFTGEDVGSPAALWVPLSIQPRLNPGNSFLQTRNVSWLQAMGRLRPDVSIPEARASMDVLLRNLQTALKVNPQSDYLGSIAIEPGSGGFSGLRDRYAQPLWMLMGLVALVLAIACVNVASLLLARSEARQREFAVRLAIGAGRSRLLRQLLTEACLLAVIACVAGLIAAEGMIRLLVAISEVDSVSVRLNVKVLVFAIGASSAAALLFGLAPAMRGNRVDPWPTLKQSRTSLERLGPRLTPLRLLVAAQTAIAVVLLIASGLLLRTFLNLKTLNPGFEKEHVLQVNLDTSETNADSAMLGRDLAERLLAVPGVQSVSFSGFGFAQGASRVCCVDVEGYTPAPNEDRNVRVLPISPGYFATMGIPLVNGRDFTDRDGRNAPEVVIINETTARHYFGNASPIGKRLAWWPTDPKNIEIIGVARDAKYDSLRQDTPRIAYQSILQRAAAPPVLQIRISPNTTRSHAAVVQDCRTMIEAVEPNIAIRGMEPLSAAVNRTLGAERLAAGLSLGFGVIALLLTSIGLYGSVAYTVARRTSEIGIRMALGAQRSAILGMVARDGLALVLIGLVVGVGASYALAGLTASLLYGVPPRDPTTFALASVTLILVALIASYWPARRATNVDPTMALRSE
jgi:predicted permease